MMIYSINRKPRITIKEIENAMTRNSLEKLPRPLMTPQLVAAHSLFLSPLYELDRPRREFHERMSQNNVTISARYINHTKFARVKENEKHIFEFANRLGVFIEYIFIESLKARNKKTDNDAKVIIDNAIDLNGIFRDFSNLFSKDNPNRISEAFRNVYPAAGILEKYWSDRVQLAKKFKEEEARIKAANR